MLRRTSWIVALALGATWLAARPVAQQGAKGGDWRYWGGDVGSTKYSSLDLISKDNVKDLRVVWRWKTENFGARPEFNSEVTPLAIDGVLYAPVGSRRDVVAIDGATGETLWVWRHDEGPRGEKAPNYQRNSGRGIAHWTDGRDGRIFAITSGYHLAAIDAKTGRAIREFGKDGIVDLYEGLDQPVPKDGDITSGSPPLVVGDVVVVGADLGGGMTKQFVTGHVRGFDVRTGRRVWIFHTIPRPGELGNETWEQDSWSYTGHVGVWAPMSADEELGYVYLPIETATNDYYGGHRPGNNLFAESLVCLDAKTGKRRWHFQLIHHGIWDYDIPTAPILLDVSVDGQPIKAVAQLTKQGFAYVFDRVTGHPIWPIEERPVPQSEVPGEKTSATQPFPTKPQPFDLQGLTPDNLIDLTPELKAEATKIASQYKTGPLFTPPIPAGWQGLKGTIILPASLGSANWQGGAADPETGILYVGSIAHPGIASLRNDPKISDMEFYSSIGGFQDPRGEGCGDFGPQGLPLVKPPWGRITAINLNTGEHAWMVANGETPDCVKNAPALKNIAIPKTGKPERPGILLTKTLLFAGEGGGVRGARVGGGGGPMFRAYDKQNGQIVSELTLPGNQTGNPMTYLAGGRQYIGVAIGGVGQAAELVGLALP